MNKARPIQYIGDNVAQYYGPITLVSSKYKIYGDSHGLAGVPGEGASNDSEVVDNGAIYRVAQKIGTIFCTP